MTLLQSILSKFRKPETVPDGYVMERAHLRRKPAPRPSKKRDEKAAQDSLHRRLAEEMGGEYPKIFADLRRDAMKGAR